MDKQSLLSAITDAAKSGSISESDVKNAYAKGAKTTTSSWNIFATFNLAKVFSVLGIGIVIIGVIILVAQHWEDLPSFSRILITLGTAIAAYIVGATVYTRKDAHMTSMAAFVIAFLLLPLGSFVTLYELNVDIETASINSLLSFVLSVIAIASLFTFRHSIFIVFSLLFSTWFYFAFTNLLFEGNITYVNAGTLNEYRVLALGIGYMFFARYLAGTDHRQLAGKVSAIGLILLYGAAMALGGWRNDANILWEIAFPVIAIGFMYGSTQAKSESMLWISTIALMGYIIKITGEYFSDTLGWPLMLILIGIMLLGVGYISVRISKKYV